MVNGLGAGFGSRGFDASSAVQPVGNTNRGLFATWFNAKNIAKEDWLRAEQSAQLDFERQNEQMKNANEFNALEAEKQRAWETEMSNTSYQRAVEDMKKSGINPILLYNNGGASTPTGSSATASNMGGNYRRSGKGLTANTEGFLSLVSTIAMLGAGLYKAGLSSKTSLAVAGLNNSNKNLASSTVIQKMKGGRTIISKNYQK